MYFEDGKSSKVIVEILNDRLKEHRQMIEIFTSILVYESEVTDEAVDKLMDMLEEHGFVCADDDNVRAMRSPEEN